MRSKTATHYGPFYTVRFPNCVIFGIHSKGRYLALWTFRSSAPVSRAVLEPLGLQHRKESVRDVFVERDGGWRD